MCELSRQYLIIERAFESEEIRKPTYWSKDSGFTGEETNKYIEAILKIHYYRNTHDGNKPSVEEVRSMVFGISEEEKQYMTSCETFNPDMPYEEYVVHVYRCLLVSDWHYKPETATRIIKDEAYWVRKLYEKRNAPASTMAEVGFGCG